MHAPGRVLKAEGIGCLSRSVAAERRKAESFSSLRGRAREAAQFGEGISIDLFATAENSLVPGPVERHAEPLAEGVDALAQPGGGLVPALPDLASGGSTRGARGVGAAALERGAAAVPESLLLLPSSSEAAA